MFSRCLAGLCLAFLVFVAWLVGRGEAGREREPGGWVEVAPGVLRSPGLPAGYALVDGEHALLIDAPGSSEALGKTRIKTIDVVLLTHHHRDTAAWSSHHLAAGVPVRAAKAAAPWLTPAGVERYWKESLPLRGSRTAYLVLPEGLPGVRCDLEDGQTIEWRGWSVRVIATPGHSPDHLAFGVRRKDTTPWWIFCGDALAAPGKLWTPYTTDWDHWTDQGLKPAAESLGKLMALEPALLLPAHGPVISRDTGAALDKTARAIREMAFLKSYERYTKERSRNPPRYAFLAPEQAGTNGSKPWSKLSRYLWVTGNTYVLISRDGPCLVVDPWDPHSAKQIPKLQADEKIGRVEVVLCSHAHFDHYDGAYTLLDREKPEVWTLKQVAEPIADPYRLRAPFLDARPLTIHRRFEDGATAAWREYRLKFHFLPGQTEYTMGVETIIDGKKCLFTADNFFHHDLFSGTGGWMGLNRSGPLLYEASARKVRELAPEWVLAEHGSAMEYNAEDFGRRIEWGQVSARAADALCSSGDHRHDWNPHHVRVEPILQRVGVGARVRGTVRIDNLLSRQRKLRISLAGRGILPDQSWEIEVPAGGSASRSFEGKVADKVRPGRHILPLRVLEGDVVDGSDAFLAVEVVP
jgi:glyoxylase-like metal-dependent hydrolase (beta-lactamase superfamily II)